MKDVLKKRPIGPKTYDSAYEEAMKRIEGHDAYSEELAKQVLSWITCSKRPLSTSELQCALAVEVGEVKLDNDNLLKIEDMVLACAGLVTIDEESNIIRLVHYTAQEYFERTQSQWFPNVQANITTICVSYLLFDEFESGICQNDDEFEQRLELNKLYDYAAHNWGYHAREALTSCEGVIEFLQRQAQVEASSQALMAVKSWSGHGRYSQQIPKQMAGIHLAAHFGVKVVTWQLLEQGADVNAAAQNGETPLYWALSNGHLEVSRLLLDNGADVETVARDGGTLLHLASRRGHPDFVRLLLENGADANAAAKNGETPLYWASSNGYLEVSRLLLDNGADVNAAT